MDCSADTAAATFISGVQMPISSWRVSSGTAHRNGISRCRRSAAGNLRNAIPREAEAVFGICSDHSEDVKKYMDAYAEAIRNEYKRVEPSMNLCIEPVERPEYCIDSNTSLALVRALYSAPHGVYSMSRDLENLVETSTNLAAVKMEGDNKIKITTSQRSSVESRKNDMAGQVEAHFQLAGAEVTHSDGYPGWAPDMNSPIMHISAEAYEELFGQKPAIKAIHAGLECGLFLSKNPDLDMVSIRPHYDRSAFSRREIAYPYR